MKHTFKYIVSVLVLFIPAIIFAQENPPIYNGYHVEGGVATKKSVSDNMDSNGNYTLTLETFATGATTISQKAVPSDIVLALDLSTSMGGHRGYVRKLTGPTQPSINDIETDDPTYAIYRSDHGFGYQISVYEYTPNNGSKRYYPYCIFHSNVMMFKSNGEWSKSNLSYDDLSSGANTDPNPTGVNFAFATNKTETGWVTFSPSTKELDYAVWHMEGDKKVYDETNEEVVQIESSRIHELKDAVLEFIDAVVDNDRYKIVDGQKVEREAPLGNKLAIVAWATPYISAQSTALLSLTDANITSLKNKARAFTLYDGTKPNVGIDQANTLLRGSGRSGTVGEDFLRTIVFFTDGQPDNGFDPAIASSHTSKSNIGATVYSVGLFSLEVGATEVAQETQNFMNYVSSNFPDATTYDNHGEQVSGDYYMDVSTGDADLTQVFKTIAQASGGSEKTVPSATQVVDGVTNSFTIPTPAGATAPTIASAQVRVYTRSINASGNAWGTTQTELTLVEMTTDAEIQTPDPTKSYMTDASEVGVAIKNGRLIIMGFDYSKADTNERSLDGNWVGWRYPEGTEESKTCAGKELVIEFKIQGDPDATGGDHTQTNTADSGVLVPTYNEDGSFKGYDNVNKYELPQADIPINIVIKKVGLRHGESATIQIYWAPQSTEYDSSTGKLKPDLVTPWAGNGNEAGWGNFSKVILTNKGEDGAAVFETLLCLDPKYVYRLEEDDWGWSYDLDTEITDTSKQVKNPFVFTNTEKTDVVKHAEAASFNRFGNELHGRQRVETVKSSKVKTFTNPTEDK